MSDIKVKHEGREYILGSPEYYRSFIEEEKETPKMLQDKMLNVLIADGWCEPCLLYTSPSPRD